MIGHRTRLLPAGEGRVILEVDPGICTNQEYYGPLYGTFGRGMMIAGPRTRPIIYPFGEWENEMAYEGLGQDLPWVQEGFANGTVGATHQLQTQTLQGQQMLEARRRSAELASRAIPVQGAWMLTADEMRAHGDAEAEEMSRYLESLVHRVRSGEIGAMTELREAMSHHDVIETMQVMHQASPPGRVSQAQWERVQRALRDAQATLEGRGRATPPPRRGESDMVWPVVAGLGIVAVAAVAIAYVLRGR